MKSVILSLLAAVAIAAPDSYPHQGRSIIDSDEHVAILKDDRVHEEDGTYNVEVETANDIKLSQSGSPRGPEGAVVKAGEFSYTAPDGQRISVKYVADENGFQPQSDSLPVAPAFPHPIPRFVLDQITFAAEEDAAIARGRSESTGPSDRYKYGSR
ncbi:cuticle protein AMP1A-like [Homarus americanus]|uniref:cuticle protein AMP1A-like n=1 Tax=Homarus americanus TaxID=6706 RepID=UPI001C443536|nr:cuticle protein AMP1A-like [Homarus americanus]